MPINSNVKSTRWCFTINNPTEAHKTALAGLDVVYLVYGEEIAPTTLTPHLQGFLVLPNARYRNAIATDVGGGHWERTRGSSIQAADYCRKDGVFTERGTLPDSQGRRTDLESHVAWLDQYVADNGRFPSNEVLARERIALPASYPRLVECARLRYDPPTLREGELNEWQSELDEILTSEADDRSVVFYVDSDGGKGKSWFQQYAMSRYDRGVQLLGVGKRDDMAHAVDPSKSIFLINVPRGGMEYLQYTILEQLKDRLVFSPKYHSTMKVIEKTPHVVVFCNEAPDLTKMSEDRYCIKTLS